LRSGEWETFADLVARASGAEEGLEEKEFGGNEWRERHVLRDSRFEGAKSPAPVFALSAGEGDMRMVGAGLGDNSTPRGGCDDEPLYLSQLGGDFNPREEDSSAIEKTGAIEPDPDGPDNDFAQAAYEAVVVFV